MRQSLPNRRPAETLELEVAGLHYTATIGRFADGRIAEIFLTNHRVNSSADTNARPVKQRIFETVQRRPGITAADLRDVVWADDPNGGPECRHTIFVHVSQLNHLLEPHGIVIRSQGGGYQIRAVTTG
jgi:hypothetical protein